MDRKVKIIHADDHELVRRSLKSLIEQKAPHIEIVGQVGSYWELFNELSKTKFDLLVLDGEIKGVTASDYLPKIKALYPNLKIILFWVFAEVGSLTTWIHLLDGHLNLSTASDEIVYAIDTVMRGERYFTIPVFANHGDS